MNERKRTNLEMADILEKSKKLQNITLDHKNQKIVEKFCEDFTYFDNPLRRERNEDIPDISQMNQEIETLIKKKVDIEEKKNF